ncbi:hypothetical protein BKA93DRAFT_466213 [Sparassis latifolia]
MSRLSSHCAISAGNDHHSCSVCSDLYMLTSLQNLRAQTLTMRASTPLPSASPKLSYPSRSPSPALSNASSTSSSSTSTHTATPRTPRPGRLAGLTPTSTLTNSTSTQSISSTTTSRTITPTSARRPRSRSRTETKRQDPIEHVWGAASPPARSVLQPERRQLWVMWPPRRGCAGDLGRRRARVCSARCGRSSYGRSGIRCGWADGDLYESVVVVERCCTLMFFELAFWCTIE